MKKKNLIIYMLALIISMTIAIILIMKTQGKINKYDYVVDNANMGSNISIMIYDDDLNDYVKADKMPVGFYTLNSEKTTCVAGGEIINYDFNNGTVKFNFNTADECYLYFDLGLTIAEKCKGQNAALCLSENYELDSALYHHTEQLANSAGDGSYRYVGADPDNYVCFEGNDCTNQDNLYRIIGIFEKQIKLIKYKNIGGMPWNNSLSNVWGNSSLVTYLNGNYITSLGDVANLIADTIWHVGGYSSNSVTPKTMLNAEMSSNTTVTRKIGLMYVSDYGYAAPIENWNLSLYSYSNSARDSDWLYDSANHQWTISRDSSNSTAAFYLNTNGYPITYSVTTNYYVVRPCFYLKSNVEIKSGTGTKADPYILR